MSSISKITHSAPALFAAVLALLFVAPFTHAQSSLSVSVTPPLFQLTIGPGESWSSSIKVVNNNAYDVTYYTQLVDMEADGEEGQSKFTPLVDEVRDPSHQTFSLASWIEISGDPVVVPAGRSASIPFTVRVPDNAEPGGHYGAILVGTQPGSVDGSGATVKVSSFVSSLLFVRIKGDVIESGRIREFTTPATLYQTPKANFVLRFENTGNAHLKPEGEITIYNMWGKERGRMEINQGSGNFGNVLPKSIRKFEFAWEGESNPFDIGYYSAVVTLGFGEDGKQNVSAKTYFWIVPIVPLSVGLGLVVLFILLMTWFIRRYIRRSLALESARFGISTSVQVAHQVVPTIETLVEPLREGVIDLRAVAGGRKQSMENVARAQTMSQESIAASREVYVARPLTLLQFIFKYRLFLLFVVVLVVGGVLAWRYFEKVLVPERHFEIRDVSIREEIPYK